MDKQSAGMTQLINKKPIVFQRVAKPYVDKKPLIEVTSIMTEVDGWQSIYICEGK